MSQVHDPSDINPGVSEFGELLAELVAGTAGARGAVLSDGIDDTIDTAHRPAIIERLDLCIFGAQIGQAMDRLNIDGIIFGLGRPVVVLESDQVVLMCKVLWEHYLLTLVLDTKSNLARAMRDFEVCGDALLALLR